MYVVNLATAIELSCMHAQSINFNNLLSNIFSNEKGRKFHLTCISWSDGTYLYSFTSVCIGYRVIVAMSDRIPPVQTVKQLPRPKKLTKIDTLIFSYANVNDYSQCDNVNFVKL